MRLTTAISLLIVSLVLVLPLQNCQDARTLQEISEQQQLQLSSLSSESSQDVSLLFQRLVGHKIDVDDPIFLQMNQLVDQGDLDKAIELALEQPGFLNVTVRDMAARMSTQGESTLAPLSDFVATFMGVVRDQTDARELLTGNFYYRGGDIPGVGQNTETDIVKSNRHYEQLSASGADIGKSLVREEGQKIFTDGGITVLEDAAGLITTRGFMLAHADMGTNRRLVEFSFRQFLCEPITNWASTSYPDNRVGRDVGRTPISEYRNKCVSCHAPMDALRPAFAHVDFFKSGTTGFIQYGQVYNMDPNPEDPAILDQPVPSDEQRVPSKFRRAKSVFPEGFAVRSDRWENYTFENDQLGWRDRSSGVGMNQYGEMLANSRAYSRCMVQRVFDAVCFRHLSQEENGLLEDLTTGFEVDYNIRKLFSKVVVLPECAGLQFD